MLDCGDADLVEIVCDLVDVAISTVGDYITKPPTMNVKYESVREAVMLEHTRRTLCAYFAYLSIIEKVVM